MDVSPPFAEPLVSPSISLYLVKKALTRVKSMVQYPEGRAQYRRLLTVVEGFRETKSCDMALSRTEETVECEDLFDSLLDDDTFMSIAFE